MLQRERKFIHTAHRNIRGKAIIDTSKLNQTIHRIDVGIIVHIFAQRITANAEVNESIHVHTKANTKIDITFELCNIVVVNIPLRKDLNEVDVNFFIKFLNHPLENHETDCSI